MIEIKFDDKKLKILERELRSFGRNALPKVMSRALNRTAMSARTASARFLSRETGVKIKDVRKRIIVERANYKIWRSAIRVSGKRLSLGYLQPRMRKSGLSVKHGGKRVRVTKAFEAKRGFFIRQPRGGTGREHTIGVGRALEIDQSPRVGRLPIARIRGPVLAKVYTRTPEEVSRIQAESMNKLEKNVNDQVRLILSKRIPA